MLETTDYERHSLVMLYATRITLQRLDRAGLLKCISRMRQLAESLPHSGVPEKEGES